MYVSVAYRKPDLDTEAEQAFTPRKYTYATNLDVKEGDMVIAPTVNGELTAIVREVDLPEPPFPCKEITQFYEPEQTGGNDVSAADG